MDEIESLEADYGVTSFNFYDDTLNQNPGYLSSLCDLILARKLTLRWQCNLRANPSVTKELMLKMKAAGCTGIWMGIESASPRILKLVKHASIDQMRQVIAWCDEIGLQRRLNYIVSFPGETLDEAERTVALAKELGEPFMVNPLVILPGTGVERIAREIGYLPKDFSWADRRPAVKYRVAGPGRMAILFIDKIPLHEVLRLLRKFQAARARPRRGRLRRFLASLQSPADLASLFSWSNALFVLAIIRMNLSRFTAPRKWRQTAGRPSPGS